MAPQESNDPRLDPDILAREGLSEALVEAVGKLSEAFETTEVARGHLYAFHQTTGRADLILGDAVELLREAGAEELADRVEDQLLGRNVLVGRWTFQVVEEYDADYYALFKQLDADSRALVAGHHHLFEAGLKRDRRSRDEPGHEASPADV